MARKKKLSEAELQAKKIKEIKNENRFCPEPTRFFSVGEKVRLGAWPSPYIKEVLDDGKYYLISDEDIHRGVECEKAMEKNRAKILFMGFPEDAKKAIEVAIELKYSQCLHQFLNYKRTYEKQNNHVI